MNETEYSNSKLYVRGDRVIAGEITRLLGTGPDEAYEPGQVFLGNALGGQRTSSYTVRRGHWRLDFPKNQRQTSTIEEQLEYWCQFLSSRETAVRALCSLGYSITIDCYISEGPVSYFTLPAALMSCFGRLQVALSFGIYDWTSKEFSSD
jgi:hypothetical protein